MMDIINMNVQDRLFILVWYDYHKKVDIIWRRITGRETKLPSKDPLVSICYQKKEEPEECGEETPMNVYQLTADYYCNDLYFV